MRRKVTTLMRTIKQFFRIFSFFMVLWLPIDSRAVETEPTYLYDSLSREWNKYDTSRLQEFKDNPEFNYEVAKADLNLIERIWNWILGLFDGLFEDSEIGFWPKVFKYSLYTLSIAGVVFLIIKLFQSGLRNMIYGNNRTTLEYEVHEENIHEIDFINSIEEAVALGEFRKAIRLVYLHALKKLSDEHLISWERGKTNHDYLYELKSSPIQQPFSDLGYYFEFTWYGNFDADRKIYDQAFSLLKDLEKKLKQGEKI